YFLIKSVRKYFKGKIVYNVQDIFPDSLILMHQRRTLFHKILEVLNNKAYKLVNKIVTISYDMQATLKNKQIPDEKIKVIFNWSTDKKHDLSGSIYKFRDEFKLNESDFIVLYAGNLGYFQNTSILLEAGKQLKDNEN